MGSNRPRLVFMGTPELARTALRALADSGAYDIALVVAQPDKPVGRGLDVQPPPVKVEALSRGLPVAQPLRAREPGFIASLRALAPDVIVVAAYGQILPAELLEIPRRGCLNIHTSLLPRWRGAAPIQWAILEGDSETGVSIMLMDVGLDTGPVIATTRTKVEDRDTGQTLHDRLARLGSELLLTVLPRWLEGELSAQPQPAEGVTYARKLSKADGRIDWTRPAESIARQVRALNPWPVAFTTSPSGILKVWQASTVEGSGSPGEVLAVSGDRLIVAAGRGAVACEVLQREGRKKLPAREFLAGANLAAGDRLGD
jgi:methionyl-tRNA formyltransferase